MPPPCETLRDAARYVGLVTSQQPNSINSWLKPCWKGGIQYKCYIRFGQIWEDLPPIFPKFGGQVLNFGGIPPYLALDITLTNEFNPRACGNIRISRDHSGFAFGQWDKALTPLIGWSISLMIPYLSETCFKLESTRTSILSLTFIIQLQFWTEHSSVTLCKIWGGFIN